MAFGLGVGFGSYLTANQEISLNTTGIESLQEITVAMILDDVLHVAALFIAHTQQLPFAVVL